jgi:hypothetical protein
MMFINIDNYNENNIGKDNTNNEHIIHINSNENKLKKSFFD